MKSVIRFCFICLLTFIKTQYVYSQKWDSVPGPFPGTNAISVMYADSNYLYVGGEFNKLQGIHTQGIARWNGTKWDSMGAGIDRLIMYDTSNWYPPHTYAMATYHNKLYVGGESSSLGYLNAPGIGTWDGTSWDTIPIQPFVNRDNISTGIVDALTIINNKLYVGGAFDTVAGKRCIGITCWNDTNWTSLNFPNLSIFSYIDAICEYKGSIYVGGLFWGANTIDNIGRWDSTGWHTVGQGIPGSLSDVWSMVVYDGELYVGGEFSISDGNVGNNIEKWDGTKWSDVGGGTDHQVYNLIVYNGKLYAMGVFTEAGGVPADGIAEWDGTKWCSFAGKIANVGITSSAIYKDSLYIGGGFATLTKDTVYYLAEWAGGNYTDSCGTILAGVNEVKDESEKVKVYPNPSNGVFTIQLNGQEPIANTYIQIYNVVGQQIYSSIIKDRTTEINLNGQPQGVYLYRVTTETATLVDEGKVVLQK